MTSISQGITFPSFVRLVAKVAHERTTKIIPESRYFKECHIPIGDSGWHREIMIFSGTDLNSAPVATTVVNHPYA